MRNSSIESIVAGIRAGHRASLSRAITLVESENSDHMARACRINRNLASGALRQGIRIGVTGAPGVGKSTFIDAIGTLLIEGGMTVAVLAVDPTSPMGGGSILGDKTRMPNLARHPGSFIRPSPSGHSTDGVGNQTGEAAWLCEQAGYDVVIVETTGAGQTDFQVAEVTDIFVLLVTPHGGDELQGIKRGIMEHADAVVVTKCDGDLERIARRTCTEYSSALHLFRRRQDDPETVPFAMTVSSRNRETISACWDRINHLAEWRRNQGSISRNRREQAVRGFHAELDRQFWSRLGGDSELRERMSDLEDELVSYRLTTTEAARQVMDMLIDNKRGE